MTKHTSRDKLWSIAVRKCHRDKDAITSEELAKFGECSQKTARDMLNTAAENGILRRETIGREVRYVGDFREPDLI